MYLLATKGETIIARCFMGTQGSKEMKSLLHSTAEGNN